VEIEGYDVFVNPEAIIEISRGENMTIAQAFGEDWQAAPAVHIHPAALRPAEPPRVEVPEAWKVQPAFQPGPPDRTLFYFCAFVIAVLCAAAILWSHA